MMVSDTQNYWMFPLCPLSSVLKNTRERNVLETGKQGWKEIRNRGHVAAVAFLMNVAKAKLAKQADL
jgi:hypothetical protein